MYLFDKIDPICVVILFFSHYVFIYFFLLQSYNQDKRELMCIQYIKTPQRHTCTSNSHWSVVLQLDFTLLYSFFTVSHLIQLNKKILQVKALPLWLHQWGQCCRLTLTSNRFPPNATACPRRVVCHQKPFPDPNPVYGLSGQVPEAGGCGSSLTAGGTISATQAPISAVILRSGPTTGPTCCSVHSWAVESG